MKLSDSDLKKVMVRLLDRTNVILVCENCFTRFSPNVQPGGRLPRYFWRCPKGCNAMLNSKGERVK